MSTLQCTTHLFGLTQHPSCHTAVLGQPMDPSQRLPAHHRAARFPLSAAAPIIFITTGYTRPPVGHLVLPVRSEAPGGCRQNRNCNLGLILPRDGGYINLRCPAGPLYEQPGHQGGMTTAGCGKHCALVPATAVVEQPGAYLLPVCLGRSLQLVVEFAEVYGTAALLAPFA